MKYNETEAYRCRYGDEGGSALGDCEVLGEESMADYQGNAAVLARRADGTYAFLEWSYGSCSGCDGWEASNLSYEQIVEEMIKSIAIFKTKQELFNYMTGLETTMPNHWMIPIIKKELELPN